MTDRSALLLVSRGGRNVRSRASLCCEFRVAASDLSIWENRQTYEVRSPTAWHWSPNSPGRASTAPMGWYDPSGGGLRFPQEGCEDGIEGELKDPVEVGALLEPRAHHLVDFVVLLRPPLNSPYSIVM